MSETATEHLYYDGTCGVCHWAVRFVAVRDPGGAFRFAPLDGETFRERVPEPARADLPDSIVVTTTDGRVLVRSTAVVHILWRIGGMWRPLGALLAVIPRVLRDTGYAAFARVRRRLAPPPEGACPLMPPELGRRFDP